MGYPFFRWVAESRVLCIGGHMPGVYAGDMGRVGGYTPTLVALLSYIYILYPISYIYIS